jgi:hypothetical protein
MSTTPTTPDGLTQYDHLPWHEAVVRAWELSGVNAAWHARMQDEVRASMPLVARALDRAQRGLYVAIQEGYSAEVNAIIAADNLRAAAERYAEAREQADAARGRIPWRGGH